MTVANGNIVAWPIFSRAKNGSSHQIATEILDLMQFGSRLSQGFPLGWLLERTLKLRHEFRGIMWREKNPYLRYKSIFRLNLSGFWERIDFAPVLPIHLYGRIFRTEIGNSCCPYWCWKFEMVLAIIKVSKSG